MAMQPIIDPAIDPIMPPIMECISHMPSTPMTMMAPMTIKIIAITFLTP
jgi:hypothetical protein